MIVAAGFFVAGVGCSLALIIRELRKAPEGYEDEHGFYTVRNGAVKYGVPDSMKSRRTRSSPNWACTARPRIKAFRMRGLSFFGKRALHAASKFSATSRRRVLASLESRAIAVAHQSSIRRRFSSSAGIESVLVPSSRSVINSRSRLSRNQVLKKAARSWRSSTLR